MHILFLISILFLCLYRIKIKTKGTFDDYLSKDKTNSIKGIFILLIFLTHSYPYIVRCGFVFDSLGDEFFVTNIRAIGQLVVVMFLFYSGYGVGESYKKKGELYISNLPKHRIAGTLINFDIAVVIYIFLNLLLNEPLSIKKCLLSFFAWNNVGNSNWYIFVILACYSISYISVKLNNNMKKSSVLMFIFSFILIIILSKLKDTYWYNTLLCYPMGFFYSTHKLFFERLFKHYYYIIQAICIMLFISLCVYNRDIFSLKHNIVSILFAIVIVLFTMKISICNKPLRWLGENLFPLYIYMRIPMLILEKQTPFFIKNYPLLFIIVSIVVTIIITLCYNTLWRIKI